MPKTVTIADAKARLSGLATRAEDGEEIDITRHGRIDAHIAGAPRGITRTPGDWNWRGAYDKSVFAPMTDREMQDDGWPV
jgi:prevent-host-death family protein